MIEGYWYSGREGCNLPIPVPNILSKVEAYDLYMLIVEKEKSSTSVTYRGFSTSRIDGSTLGSNEFRYKEWSWPGDFAEHYVLKHRVKPSEEFIKFLDS